MRDGQAMAKAGDLSMRDDYTAVRQNVVPAKVDAATAILSIALAETQTPLFEGLRESFKSVGASERDGIVSKLDDFVTCEVQARLDQSRNGAAPNAGARRMMVSSGAPHHGRATFLPADTHKC